MRSFEVVPDSERGDSRGAGKSPAWLALLDGKTIAIPPGRSIGNWSRQARAAGKRVRTHRRADESIVVWLEDRDAS